MKSLILVASILSTLASASLHSSGGSLPIHNSAHERALAAFEDDDHELTERDYAPFVNENDEDEEDWEDLPGETIGLMMERDVTPVELTSLEKRAELEGGWKGLTRDVERSTVELSVDERGNIVFPTSWEDVSNNVRRLSKRVGTNFKAAITWYTKHDLLNPSCCDDSGYTPTDKSLISAVTLVWSGKPKCGQYLKLRAKNGKKSVIVRVVDSCAGCPPQVPHVDLTKAAFAKLYDLDVGFVSGIQVKKVSTPFSKYTKTLTRLFGPESL